MRLYCRLLPLALACAGLLGCTWTMSPARQQRISDCVTRCEARGMQPMDSPSSHETYRDTRTPCERGCHTLK
jgi:hypothetical protein